MLLTLQERFAVLSILPAEANFATLRIMHDLRTVLAPTETELAEFEIENMEGGGVRWDPAKTFDAEGNPLTVDVKVGRKAHSLICEALNKLDDEKKLTDQHYSVYEKFVESDGEATGREPGLPASGAG